VIGVWVALAGGIGAALRFVVDSLVARRARRTVPLGTLVINVSGSFLLGLLTALALDHAGLADLKIVLGTGLLGGYTTFSTASVEAVNLSLADGPRSLALAAGHAGGMLATSMAAAGLGLWLG
jgi:fluoride exporter